MGTITTQSYRLVNGTDTVNVLSNYSFPQRSFNEVAVLIYFFTNKSFVLYN